MKSILSSNQESDLGPPLQSQRLNLYETYAKQLLDSGKAYHCFCDPTRLELLRKNVAKRLKKIGYHGKCRHLTKSQVDKLINEKRPHIIQFKSEETEEEGAFNDMAVGPHKSAPGRQETDFIIMKSDRFPTYHFANVVDDHLMKIKHFFRGQ